MYEANVRTTETNALEMKCVHIFNKNAGDKNFLYTFSIIFSWDEQRK